MIKVFQYGSNCNEERFNSPKRLCGAARLLGKAQTIEFFRIAFDVWSRKNNCAASDLIPGGENKAWGILYEVPDDRIDGRRTDGCRTLAQVEGNNYEKKCIQVTYEGKPVTAVTFLVKKDQRVCDKATSVEYVGHIVKGLRDSGVPEEYVLHVINVAIENIKANCSQYDKELLALENLRVPPA